jgi:hypothetical protein
MHHKERNMAKPITITTTTACWVSKDNMRNLIGRIERGDAGGVVTSTFLYGPPERKTFADYVRVGEADVTFRLLEKGEQTKLMVGALQAQLAEERLKWHARQEAILAEISKLSAIEYVEAVG